ncbi:hypothetical protein LZ31DRAFT_151109 [Colletotrichum somersetense]|nr:hypothetical protein LZ31DRAFT_151109 [Colletotrichum somersetense]
MNGWRPAIRLPLSSAAATSALNSDRPRAKGYSITDIEKVCYAYLASSPDHRHLAHHCWLTVQSTRRGWYYTTLRYCLCM